MPRFPHGALKLAPSPSLHRDTKPASDMRGAGNERKEGREEGRRERERRETGAGWLGWLAGWRLAELPSPAWQGQGFFHALMAQSKQQRDISCPEFSLASLALV